jgi:hypothetical protein
MAAQFGQTNRQNTKLRRRVAELEAELGIDRSAHPAVAQQLPLSFDGKRSGTGSERTDKSAGERLDDGTGNRWDRYPMAPGTEGGDRREPLGPSPLPRGSPMTNDEPIRRPPTP